MRREHDEVGERAEERQPVGLVDEQLVGIGQHRAGAEDGLELASQRLLPRLGKHARIIAGAGIGDLDILPRMTSANPPSLRDALIVAAVAALLIVSPLGRHLIAYSGEARMALLARDMIERRVLFQARVEGQPLPEQAAALPVEHRPGLAARGTSDRRHGAGAGRHCRHRDGGLDLSPRGPALRAPRRPLGRADPDPGATFFGHSQVLLPDMLVAAFATAAAYASSDT